MHNDTAAQPKWITIDDTRGKKNYEWPRNAYAYLQEVRNRLGIMAATEVECVLMGSMQKFYNLRPNTEVLVRELAKKHFVQLPC